MEENAKLKKQFHEELDTLKIRWPGGDEISFGDDQNLREMLRCQYPDWKTKGKVTSVPTARVPAMFLSPEMLSEKLNKHYERIQKGDEGELKVYKKMLDGFGHDHDGIIILPNLDNNQLFKSKIGCVEIDMIILHPTKGVFVVSVKNKDLGGQDEIEKEKEKLKTDMIKHTDFVWHLSSYQDIDQPCSSSSVVPFIPIHAVFFHLRADFANIEDLETNQAWYSYKNFGNVIVFQQPQFDIFQKNWCQKMSKIPDVQLGEHFETLVSRLVAISSMEGAIALIHHKIASNDMQSMQIKKKDADEWTEKQLDDVRDKLPKTTKEHLKKCMQSSFVPTKRGKTKVILWTKEQLEIIAEVFDALTNKKKKSMRLLVGGPKGSGKTMLLAYLAKLAKNVLGSKGTVLVCDGSYGNPRILLSQIRQKLEPLKIKVVDGANFEEFSQIKKGLILFDEEMMVPGQRVDNLFNSLTDEVLVCSFTSTVIHFFIRQNYSDFRALTQILRSTSKLSQFSNNFSSAFNCIISMKGKIAHNLASEGPDIVTVPAGQMHSVCVETVAKYLLLSNQLDSILVVTNYLTLTSQIAIFEELTHKYMKIYTESEADQLSSAGESTQIWLLGNYFDGLEFGTVIIPFEEENRRPIVDPH